jgi:hypothetical protein
MVALLTSLCGIGVAPADPVAFGRAYDAAVQSHVLCGLAMAPPLPAQVYRYMNSAGILHKIEAVLRNSGRTDLADILKKRLTDAEAGSLHVTWDDAVQFVREPVAWNTMPKQQVPLSGKRATFVTFDANPPPPRTSAIELHRALALPWPQQPCFIEVRYALRPGDVLHFPTVADAGWYRFFSPTPQGHPHGRTQPHAGGTLGQQPEAVQDAPTLDHVQSAADMRLVPP